MPMRSPSTYGSDFRYETPSSMLRISRNLVVVNHANQRAIRAIQTSLGRRPGVVPQVNEALKGRIECRRVVTGGFRQTLQTASIQLDSIHIKASMAAFGTGEIH